MAKDLIYYISHPPIIRVLQTFVRFEMSKKLTWTRAFYEASISMTIES